MKTEKGRRQVKKLAIAILAAATLGGCGPLEPKSLKSDYAFEIVGYEIGSQMEIVRVTNMEIGKSIKVLRHGPSGVVVLPEGF
jgi:hypothetical protein